MKTVFVYDPVCFDRAKMKAMAEKRLKWSKVKTSLFYAMIFIGSAVAFTAFFLLILLQLSAG